MVDILSVLVKEIQVTGWSHRVAMVEAQSLGWGELRCVLLDMVTLTVGSERLILPFAIVIHLRDMSCHASWELGVCKAVVGK